MRTAPVIDPRRTTWRPIVEVVSPPVHPSEAAEPLEVRMTELKAPYAALLDDGMDASSITGIAQSIRALVPDLDGVVGRTFRYEGQTAAQVIADRVTEAEAAADLLDRLFEALEAEGSA